jgi:catalase-peroxidase
MMLTTDLALRFDPDYERIARRFLEHPDEFAEAFAKAWYKLTHRDLGPFGRGKGALVPAEPQIWQDPVPPVDHELIDAADVELLKACILAAGPTVPQLVATAWASASTFRATDHRGGANGARIRLEPQRNWEANDPARLSEVLRALEGVKAEFDAAQKGGKRVSMADLIVLGGCAAIESAARAGGHAVTVPFRPGRTDATPEQTDAASFAVLEPTFDGFRNHLRAGHQARAEELLVEKALRLSLSAPEMTVLLGGMRVLDANTGGSGHGVFTDRPGTLSNDFFVELLDVGTVWTATDADEEFFEGRDRSTGELRWTATRVDLVFGSDSVLRALAEVYASADASGKFVSDFVAAWVKVMDLDRFD